MKVHEDPGGKPTLFVVNIDYIIKYLFMTLVTDISVVCSILLHLLFEKNFCD